MSYSQLPQMEGEPVTPINAPPGSQGFLNHPQRVDPVAKASPKHAESKHPAIHFTGVWVNVA